MPTIKCNRRCLIDYSIDTVFRLPVQLGGIMVVMPPVLLPFVWLGGNVILGILLKRKSLHKNNPNFAWQARFYDTVIRIEPSYWIKSEDVDQQTIKMEG